MKKQQQEQYATGTANVLATSLAFGMCHAMRYVPSTTVVDHDEELEAVHGGSTGTAPAFILPSISQQVMDINSLPATGIRSVTCVDEVYNVELAEVVATMVLEAMDATMVEVSLMPDDDLDPEQR